MKFLAVISCIHCFTLIYSSGQYLLSSSYFIKQGHVSETTDLGVFAVHKLEIPSLVECALQCGMNFLCNAFDLCFLKGLYTCRFRSGHANLTNATTQCELFENTTNKNCHNGALFGAQGPCEIILQNIALRKPAAQSSTKSDYNAAYAVDGNRGTNLVVDKCTATGDGDRYPWWRVDLQVVYNITSVRILNRGIDQYGVLQNIALRKPAAQSSTKSDYNAAYAVDGNRGTNLVVDKCTATGDGDRYPWWRVDLQVVYNITSVRILNRGIDQYGDWSDRLRDVTVTVGLTGSDVKTPCGFFAGPGTASQLVVIDCPTSTQGRFVKISQITEPLTLCEVDVFGVLV